MNQLWLGIIILLVLLALGIGITWGMCALHMPIADQLQQAGQAAMDGQWALAEKKAADAKEAWDKWWHFTAAFADHTPMDDLDGLFAELEIYAQAQDVVHFSATCAHLCQLAQAMADSHSPTWWNLL